MFTSTSDEKPFENGLKRVIAETNISAFDKASGKVRDIYDLGERLLMVTTDRLSAFDKCLTTIPFKGQVLNQISRFWFEMTAPIVRNHMVATPYANAMLVKKIDVFPVEFVVRAYITGSTNTSLWTLYQNGERHFSDTVLPEGLKKNMPLAEPLLTPSTKSSEGDRPINGEAIIKEGLMTEQQWQKTSSIALALFDFASQKVRERGLILVDTKFEFGVNQNGDVVLVDEVLTPDSSRYWLQKTYQQRLKQGLEPENFDKEIIRLWYKDHCDPYGDTPLPKTPDNLRIALAKTYVSLYEKITGLAFNFADVVLGNEAETLNFS